MVPAAPYLNITRWGFTGSNLSLFYVMLLKISGTRRWDSNPRRGEYESLVLPLNYAGVIKRDVTESAYKTPTYFSPYRVFDASNWLRSHGFAPVFKVMSHVRY